jgi:hypothetical protein
MARIAYTWIPLVLVALTGSEISQAASVGWPEAVARLAESRSKAETCVALLKGRGDDAQISRGRLAYGSAKADIDSVIAGLVTALAEGGKPDSLPTLQIKLEQGGTALAEFCDFVSKLLPSTSGQKNVIVDIAKAAIEPLVKSLPEAVAALYNDHRKDQALIRLTIQTQLEAARWPDFAEVRAAQ